MEPSRKEQVFIVTTVAVLLLGGVAFGVAQFFWMAPPPPLPVSTSPIARSMSPASPTNSSVATLDAAARDRLLKVYHLEDNEAVKYIPPPFIPERAAGMQSVFNFRSTTILNVLILTLMPDGKFQMNSGSTSSEFPVSSLLQIALGVDTAQIDAPPEIKSARIAGDWIVSAKATPAQKGAGLSAALSKALGKKLTVELSQADREVIVISGTYNLKPLEDSLPGLQAVEFFLDARDSTTPTTRSVLLTSLPAMLTSYTGKTFVSDLPTQSPPTVMQYVMYNSFMQARSAGALSNGQVQKLIDLLQQQTGLEFKTTQRKMDTWKVSQQ